MIFTRRIARITVAMVSAGGVAIGWSTSALATSSHKGGDHGSPHGGSLLLQAPLAPSVPSPSDPSIFGVAPGGAPWQLQHGKVQLGQNGTIRIDVGGLVLTSTGANPLPDIAASVFCNGALAGTTAPVPFSTIGDAQIHATISLPSTCLAPTVMLNPATGSLSTSVKPGTYIGIDGSA